MKRSTKRFTITSETKNSQSFRIRTSGIELSDFRKNPLLLWMHQRPKGEREDEILPLGYWDDIEVNNGKITGVPVFDNEDKFAMKIYKKVENGTIRMASAGLAPLEFDDSEGETWLEKSILKEGSLCDIGSNGDALSVALYNEADELVTLADVYSQKLDNPKTNTNMKLVQLSENTIGLLKLAAGANEAAVHTAILNLVTLTESQKTQLETLKGEKETAETALAEQVRLAGDAELITLVDKAETERKITADQKPYYLKMKLEDATALLATMPVNPKVATQVANGEEGNTDGLMKLSYEQLDKSGQLVTLKEKNLEGFKEKFKAKFGTDYVPAQ